MGDREVVEPYEQAMEKGLLHVWREEVGDELDIRNARENIDRDI